MLGVGARAQLLLEPGVLVGQDPARLFGRPVVAPGRVLELGEPLADGPASGVDRRRHGDRIHRERGRRGGRQLRAFSLRE